MSERRGAPPKLEDDKRRQVLRAISGGRTITAAAAAAEVTRTTIYNTADRDPAFSRDLAEARLRGKGQPVCPACRSAVLTFTVDTAVPGVACTGCDATYRLAPTVVELPAPSPSVYDLACDTPAALADTA